MLLRLVEHLPQGNTLGNARSPISNRRPPRVPWAVEAQMSPAGAVSQEHSARLTLELHDLCPACVELTRRP